MTNQKERADEWNKKLFNGTGYLLISSKNIMFWKVISILLLFYLFLSLGFFILAINSHKLDGMIQSDFNSTINVNNKYNFTPNNEFQNFNNFKPNYTIINEINLPDNIFCNCSC